MKDFSVYARGGRLEFVDATIESEVAEPPLALDGFTPGAGTVEILVEPFDEYRSFFCNLFNPVSFEITNLCPPVEALGCELVLGNGICPTRIQRFQPEDSDGPGWALLEEVRL